MHDLKEYTTEALRNRFEELQTGPNNKYEALFFYAPEEDSPWNSLDAIEAELVRREVETAR